MRVPMPVPFQPLEFNQQRTFPLVLGAMGIFNFGKSSGHRDEATATSELIHQARQAPYPSGPIARRFFGAIDRTVAVQEPLIRSYVAKIEKSMVTPRFNTVRKSSTRTLRTSPRVREQALVA